MNDERHIPPEQKSRKNIARSGIDERISASAVGVSLKTNFVSRVPVLESNYAGVITSASP